MVGGPKARRLKGLRIKAGQGMGGGVAELGKPAMVNDTRTDRGFLSDIDRAPRFITRSVLCVPIFIRKHPAAVLEMVNKIGKPFDRLDQRLLTHLAEQASIALERASLQEQATSLGGTDELTKLHNTRFLEQALDREARLTASIGIAGFPDHAQSKEELLRKADEAMYRAKAAGPNRIHVAE